VYVFLCLISLSQRHTLDPRPRSIDRASSWAAIQNHSFIHSVSCGFAGSGSVVGGGCIGAPGGEAVAMQLLLMLKSANLFKSILFLCPSVCLFVCCSTVGHRMRPNSKRCPQKKESINFKAEESTETLIHSQCLFRSRKWNVSSRLVSGGGTRGQVGGTRGQVGGACTHR